MQVELGRYAGLCVLLVGCGSIGRRHAQVLHEMGVGQMAACDPNEEQRTAMAELFPDVQLYADYGEALAGKRYDAVYVLTPPNLHLQMVQAALEADAHVFVEKPLAYSSQGVDALIRLAEDRRRQVMVGLCFRFHEGILRAKRLLKAGEIGRLVHVRALMGEHFPEVQPNYRNMYYSRYYGAFELVHDLDLAVWFAQQPVCQSHCVYGTFSDIDMQAPDTVDFLLSFKDRLSALVHLNFFQRPRSRQIELIGTMGLIQVEFARWDRAVLSCYRAATGQWEVQEINTRRNDMFRDESAEFLDAVLGEGGVTCTMAEALKTINIIEQFYTAPA